MNTLLEIGITNAVLATLLAIVVWLATRMWRQPVLVHALWVIVLVKLVTPPLFSIPWQLAPEPNVAPAVLPSLASTPADPFDFEAHTHPIGGPVQATARATAQSVFETPQLGIAPDGPSNLSATVTDEETASTLQTIHISWNSLVAALWLAGSATFLTITVFRLVRFHRALAGASTGSPQLEELAEQVASRFGIRNYRLLVSEGRLAPLVWPIGRPTIVLSRPLLAQLSTDEKQLLLAHEFAHLRRKDHWVRWLELVAVTIYWWHPVAWWSRAMIRRTEEHACDAWVAWAFPDSVRRYASALLTAVDYVTNTRPAAPMVASRLNAGGNLKERIESIMTGNCNCRLTLVSKFLVLALALGVLPFSLRAVQAADEQPASAASDLAVPSAEPESHDVFQPLPKSMPAIDVQLEAPVKVQFTEIALEDALHRLSDVANVDIVLDSAALDREGVAPDVPVTINLKKKVSLKSALNLLLKPLRLTYVVEDEVVKVTSPAPPLLAGAPPAAVAQVAQVAPVARDFNPYAMHPTTPTAPPERTVVPATPFSEAPLSTSVWKRIVEGNRQKYARAQELADKAVISSGELEQVKTDFAISLARFEQAQRALKYYQLQVELADVEYQQALAANKAGAGAVSDLEVRKLKIKVELAKAKLSELSE